MRCGTCDGTCDRPHVSCTMDCRAGGCGCKWGYVRDERTNKCIPLESCPREKQIFDELDEDEEDEAVGSHTNYYPRNHKYHVRRRDRARRKAECLTKGPRFSWYYRQCNDCEQWKKPGEAQALGCPIQYWHEDDKPPHLRREMDEDDYDEAIGGWGGLYSPELKYYK